MSKKGGEGGWYILLDFVIDVVRMDVNVLGFDIAFQT